MCVVTTIASFTIIVKWGQAILVAQLYKEVISHIVQTLTTAHRTIAQECWQLGVAHRGVLERREHRSCHQGHAPRNRQTWVGCTQTWGLPFPVHMLGFAWRGHGRQR